jgi:hypothetical protein
MIPRPVLGQAGVALLLTDLLACGTSDPTPAERPELVFAETDSVTGLSAIVGYSDAEGVREIVPGPSRLPRPAGGDLLMRRLAVSALSGCRRSRSTGRRAAGCSWSMTEARRWS